MRNKPDDIPEDVWEAARTVLDGYLYGKMSPDEAIARAILAERERCAERYRVGAGPDSWDYFANAERAILAGAP